MLYQLDLTVQKRNRVLAFHLLDPPRLLWVTLPFGDALQRESRKNLKGQEFVSLDKLWFFYILPCAGVEDEKVFDDLTGECRPVIIINIRAVQDGLDGFDLVVEVFTL